MRSFFLDIIPRIQRFSQSLDHAVSITNKHWVLIDQNINRKVVFIFREKDNQLLISEDGKIEKGSWDYLGNNSLLIDRKDGCYMFKHGFIDDTVLALKVDGKDEYALLVNEQKFEENINSIERIIYFLQTTYVDQIQQRKLTLPENTQNLSANSSSVEPIKLEKEFAPEHYPQLLSDIESLKNWIIQLGGKNAAEMIISFCRDHTLSSEFIKSNQILADKIIDNKIPLNYIEYLFRIQRENKFFISAFEKYLRKSFDYETR